MPHFAELLSLEFTSDGSTVTGTAPVRPEFFAPGTTRIRTSLLLAMVDLVAGQTPQGPGQPATGATMDLRGVILSPPPTAGWLRVRCRPLRASKRFVVSETELFADGAEVPFARATAHFIVLPLTEGMGPGRRPQRPVGRDSFDAFLAARATDERTLALDSSPRLSNGPGATINGGVQIVLAELAAEHALRAEQGPERGERAVATDIDVRFLDRLRVGPMVAAARLGPRANGSPLVVVDLLDGGDDRLLGQATVIFGPG